MFWPRLNPIYPGIPIIDVQTSVGTFEQRISVYEKDPASVLILCVPFEQPMAVEARLNWVRQRSTLLENKEKRVGILLLAKNGSARKILYEDGAIVVDGAQGMRVRIRDMELQVRPYQPYIYFF